MNKSDVRIRFKLEELARFQVLAGYRYMGQLARAAGMCPQQFSEIIRRPNARNVTLGSVGRICAALSTPERRVRLEDLVEHVPD